MRSGGKYDFDDIRRSVSAERVAELYANARVVNHRCAASWRGGDNPESVQFNADGTFKDYKSGDHGGPMALLALIRNISITEAADMLGDEFCPELAKNGNDSVRKTRKTAKADPEVVVPPQNIEVTTSTSSVEIIEIPVAPSPSASRYERLIMDGWKVVREYPYEDADGHVVYTVMRMEKDGEKTFLQKTESGWGLRDIPRILYNLPCVLEAKTVWIVEGEKDVETLRSINIVATTNSSGAEKWDDVFSRDLRGKDIVICRDNDEKGYIHVMTIARSVYPVAHSVKIICPSQDEKGDVTDYLQGGKHTARELIELAESAPLWQPERPGIVSPEMVAEAKELNKTPFKNYRLVDDEQSKRQIMLPLPINTMINEFYRRFLRYPYRLGLDILFDHDRDSRKIEIISNDDALFAWISRKSGQNYQWNTDSKHGFVSKKEFFSAVRQTAKRFEMIAQVPNYPEQENVYYTCPPLPPPSEGHQYFERLCNFFSPAEDWHKIMIKTLFAAPLYYRPMFGRPSWIIDSVEGKGVGKTTLVEILSEFYDCQPIDVSVEQLFRHYEEIIKRLVSEGGRRTRIFLLDNLTVDLSCGQFASLITKANITGRAPYSSGEDTRPNNLTYCITSNSAQVDDDLVSRSFFISLRRPKSNGKWKDTVISYIHDNRWQLFADIIDIIKGHIPFRTPTRTRYPEFEEEVLQAMCGDEETYVHVLECMQTAREAANIEQDRANQVTDGIRWKLAELGNWLNPSMCCCWIQSDLFKRWTQEITGQQIAAPTVRNYARNGLTKNFDMTLERFPSSTNDTFRRSGIMWTGETPADSQEAYIIALRGGKVVNLGTRPYIRKEQ